MKKDISKRKMPFCILKCHMHFKKMKKAHSYTRFSNVHSETQKLWRQNANVLRLEACVALFPMWLLNFQIADTCTHCIPIFCFASCKISQNVNISLLLTWSRNNRHYGYEAVEVLCSFSYYFMKQLHSWKNPWSC